ncbi:MAG: hypothetical protein V4649_12545 [Bacteroidota bacterium]
MKQIDDLFKEELGGYTEVPPPPAWAALERRLDQERKRRAFPYRWFWFITVVAFVAITGSSIAWKMADDKQMIAGNGARTGNSAIAARKSIQTVSQPRAGEQGHTRPVVTGKTIAYNSAKVAGDPAKAAAVAKKRSRKHSAAHKLNAANGINNTQYELAKENKPQTPVAENKKDNNNGYPDDEDPYYAATASIAPTPYEHTSTAIAGYTVNKRRKHNLVVADMAPKPEMVKPAEEQVRMASAANELSTPDEQTVSVAVPADMPRRASKRRDKTKATIAKSTRVYASASTMKAVPSGSVRAVKQVEKVAAKESAARYAAGKPTQAAATSAIPAASVATATAGAKRKTQTVATVPAIQTTAVASAPVAAKAKVPMVTTPVANASTKQVARAIAAPDKQLTAVASAPKAAHPAVKNTTVTKQPAALNIAASKTPAMTNTASKKIAAVTNVSATALNNTGKHVIASQVAEKKNEVAVAANVRVAKAPKNIAAAQNEGIPVQHAERKAVPISSVVAKAKVGATTPALAANPNKASVSITRTAKATNAAPVKIGHMATAAAITATARKVAKHTVTTKAEQATHVTVVAPQQASIPAVAGKAPSQDTKKATTQPVTGGKTVSKASIAATPKALAAAGKHKVSTTQPVAAKRTVTATNTAVVKNGSAPLAAKVAAPKVHSAASAARKVPAGLAAINNDELSFTDPILGTTESITAAGGDNSTPEEPKLPGTFKENVYAAARNGGTLDLLNKHKGAGADSALPGNKASKFIAGVKAGFEGSYSGQAGRKIVVSPFLEYKLSDKFSLLTQPAFKGSSLNNRRLTGTQTFYKAGGVDSSITANNPVYVFDGNGNIVDTLGSVQTYTYRHTHDSIVKSYSVGGKYFEVELPLLLKYALKPNLSVYGGVTLNYSRTIRVNENTYNSGPIIRDSLQGVFTPQGMSNTAPPATAGMFTYAGQSIGSYAGPLYPAATEGMLRLGYMLGFSYEFKKRWLLDGLLQQGFAKSNVVGGYNVNTALSVPYFRVTLGYKLTK